ncbi:MAG: hypothetical protein MK312_04720 [Roseibacillus sp.]|nr:hypothetical protein [Roseibacillus sp.]
MPPGGIAELGVKDEGVEPYEKSHPVEFFHTPALRFGNHAGPGEFAIGLHPSQSATVEV